MRRMGWVAAVMLGAVLFCSCAKKPADAAPVDPTQSVRTLRFQVSSKLNPEVLEQTDIFADRVAEMSGGLLQIEVMTGLPDHTTVKNGEADLAYLRNIQMAQADELFSMFSMPFFYDDYSHMGIALNAQEMRDILTQRLAGQNLVPLLAVYNGSSFLVTNKWELRKPSDFKELIIAMRTDNAIKLEVFQSLGARVLPYTLSSVGHLIGTEVEILPEDIKLPSDVVTIDTVEVTLEQTLQMLPDPHSLYFINTYHSLSPLWIVGNQETLGQLSEYERAVLTEGFAGLISELERQRIVRERELLAQIKAQGMTVVEVERSTIAAAIYGGKGTGTDRFTPPSYFDPRIYKLIQSFSY